jgi:CBS domain-containing protein
MPLIDGARLFTLSHGIKGINNTYTRFKQLAINDPNIPKYISIVLKLSTLSKLRTVEGLKMKIRSIYKFGII